MGTERGSSLVPPEEPDDKGFSPEPLSQPESPEKKTDWSQVEKVEKGRKEREQEKEAPQVPTETDEDHQKRLEREAIKKWSAMEPDLVGPQAGENESTKIRENLEKALGELKSLQDYDLLEQGPGAIFANTIDWLNRIGEKELAIDTFKIYLFDAIAHISESIKRGTQSDMSGFGQHVWFSYDDFIKDLPVTAEIRDVSQGIGNLYALINELDGSLKRAAGLYEEIGNVKKAEEVKNKMKELNVEWMTDEIPLYRPEGKAVWLKARQDFIDRTKGIELFSSKEERDTALEAIKNKITKKIDK